ncbi:hypothetical protein ACFSPU_02485 [Haoranjiania flava]|uniref:Discoidin domain-containing protein n=1 Tax=Haoranjiania flava TaxID=1856322 RepID=A0AAE3IKW0_9BACT|nr:hypothetical protein [Haoranjiania flava]MCU7693098.1 hypothetical protein [Haoranjiania flava]
MNNILNRFKIFTCFILLLVSAIARSQNAKYNNPEYNQVVNTFKQANENRKELERVLTHYNQNPKDSLKLRAAYFLIKNMYWGYTATRTIKTNKAAAERIVRLTDSLYYILVKGKNEEDPKELASDAVVKGIGQIKKVVQQEKKKLNFEPAPQIIEEKPDAEVITAAFLIEQIDNAFYQKENSPLVKKMSFEDFCEYTLPYRFIPGFPMLKSGKFLFGFFSKYIGKVEDNPVSIRDCIRRYNATVRNFKTIIGGFHYSEYGFEEMFFFNSWSNWDCFDQSNFAAVILNACGIPVAVENNVAYKKFLNHHANIYFHPNVQLTSFSPENEYPQISQFPVFKEDVLNFYRYHFSVQPQTPFFLKSKNEYVPDELLSPIIEDISKRTLKITSIKLNFSQQTKNNLAYLATFNSQNKFVATTWGIINHNEESVVFENAVLNTMYFPIYFEDTNIQLFGNPFYLAEDSTKEESTTKIIELVKNKFVLLDTTYLLRKFPIKDRSIEVSNSLIGTTILGGNDSTFSKVDTLYILNYAPPPYFQDIHLNGNKAYKYFKIQTPQKNLNMYFAEVEYLTDKKHQYENTSSPTPLPVFNYDELNNHRPDSLLKIWDENIIETLPQYDGNVETCPKNVNAITLSLAEPRRVEVIRFAPQNENNGIIKFNEYVLFEWEENDWIEIGRQNPEYEFLLFKNLKTNKLYWLKNLSAGTEEMPFIINDKREQVFIYSHEFKEYLKTL